MNYITFPLNLRSARTIVEVTLSGTASDVFLVDDMNLSSFKRGGRYTYYGGHYKASPVRLSPPSGGHWTAVVVPVGGSVEASVRTIG